MQVLFICVGNTCRSQMAEGFARAAGIKAHSAGITPGITVAPNAVEVMDEIGIDISYQKPDILDLNRLCEYDRIISMGCGVEGLCPALHADEDWGLADPVGLSIEVYRKVRNSIHEKVSELVKQLEQNQ